MAYVEDIDCGYKRIMAELTSLASKEVTVGVQSDAGDTKDGFSLADLAAVHEFGTVIHRDAGTVTNYRRVKKDGSFARNGRFVKKSRSNFATTSARRAYDIKIPQRSFLRSAFDENEAQISNQASAIVNDIIRGGSAASGLDILGHYIEGLVKQKIRKGPFVPNAPSTIKRKRSSRPLIDTGRLRQSIRYVVRQHEEEK